MDDFLSADWLNRYHRLWNQQQELVDGLRGFYALIEYGWADGSKPSAFLLVEDGRAVGSTWNEAPGKPDFVMKASAENWQRLCDGSLSGRAALLTKKLKFSGSMITAMKYMGPFEKSIGLLGKA